MVTVFTVVAYLDCGVYTVAEKTFRAHAVDACREAIAHGVLVRRHDNLEVWYPPHRIQYVRIIETEKISA